MADAKTPKADEGQLSESLSRDEKIAVREAQSTSAVVLHEAIRMEGLHEMGRPAMSLAVSGFVAGLAISVSVMVKAAIEAQLGSDGAGAIVGALGYSVGFQLVVLGRLQLFTENTVVPVIVVAHEPSLPNLARLLRLWAIVLVANLAGAFAAAATIEAGLFTDPAGLAAIIELSHHTVAASGIEALTRGIPAGFLVAAIAWILPNARGSEFWVVLILSAAISIGGFTHVIAGSVEAFILLLAGHLTWAQLVGSFFLPALAGNIIGGTVLFALLAHAQVTRELS